jgi:hypothetical protein
VDALHAAEAGRRRKKVTKQSQLLFCLQRARLDAQFRGAAGGVHRGTKKSQNKPNSPFACNTEFQKQTQSINPNL